MVHRVHDRLFNGSQWVVPETFSLRAISVFCHALFKVVSIDVVQSITSDATKRPLEHFFFKMVTACTVRKVHHVYLSRGEELLGLLIKKQEANILGKGHFTWPTHYVHTAPQSFNIQLTSFSQQFTANLVQEITQQIR